MTREKGLETIIVLALVLLVVYLKFEVIWLIYVALSLLIIGTIFTKLTIAIGVVWFKFSHYFGLIMNFVVMSIIFYLFLTPLAFFQKVFGKNKLRKKHTNDSYFHFRRSSFTKETIEKPW